MEEKETKKLTSKSDAALREEKILEFWEEKKIFEKSLEKTQGGKGSPVGLRPREFIFYEGPPTANGKPGIHHLISRAFKDAIPRYKTMRGYHVRRKGGWDTHGLPVELQVEKKLGLNSKKAIEDYGIAKFNQECKESVWEYLDIWNKFTKRIGYWVDQENAYITYHNDFIESVWNIVGEVNKQNLLYKDYKVVPWCPRCGTALSSHELAQGYEDVKDLSVYAKFQVKTSPDAFAQSLGSSQGSATPSQKHTGSVYILAWTTTPWTLPGNVALAVGENIDYVKIKVGDDIYILAKARLSIIAEQYEILEEMKGGSLIGMEYEPLYPYLQNLVSENENPKLEKSFRVHVADFVTTEDGTGVVHTAVMYGQDDFELGTKIGLPKQHLVGLDGKFLPGTGIFEGRFVRDEEVAVDVIKDLAHRGLLYKKEKYEHSYPHCWRCHTALIYYARDSWYIKMSEPKIKKELISENQGINWEPSHIRDGRFGEWLREIKDWAVSRERYWGTPLPVWSCEKCKKTEVIGGVAELKNKTKKSGNKYFVMRHGQAENNVDTGPHSNDLEKNAHLTEIGKAQVSESVKDLKEKIDIIISSSFNRAKETTQIVCEQIGVNLDDVIYDERISEWETSAFFEGKKKELVDKYYEEDYRHNPAEAPGNGESFAQVIKRVGQFIYELESKYTDKNILIIGHGGESAALSFVVEGMTLETLSVKDPFNQLKNAEIRKLDFIPLPHNENYELDLHRPYIDEADLVCDCGGKLTRTKEVMDVWFDSGAMPFAQDHYPFENKNWLDGAGYPADYICEAIDQTRGWFYTLHAVGILMGRGKAYKNVICLGHLLDAQGKKMSKSLGNVVDPWEMIEKYGVDALRLWMYSVNQPGESKNFDEKTVALLHSQVFGLIYNVLAFYELYRDKDLEKKVGSGYKATSGNILDKWILARLEELTDVMTKNLDNYKLLEPVRAIRDFVGDLSTWYLRRSRDRIKEGDEEAKKTLYFALKTISKLLAPFAPLATEDIWIKLKNDEDGESVHLESWPANQTSIFSFGADKRRQKIISEMETVRKVVTLGLEARQKAGIKVRQPLSRLEARELDMGQEYVDLVKEEINVKELKENKNIESEVMLDVSIDENLQAEGNYRELVRALQDMRKNTGLTPSDVVALTFETDEAGKNLIEKFEADMKKTVLVSAVHFRKNDGEEVKVDDLVFKVRIKKE